MTRFNSPGVYTSEKDLSSVNRLSLLGGGQRETSAGSAGSGGTIKSYSWLLKCGYWDDKNSWLDNENWEDENICQ